MAEIIHRINEIDNVEVESGDGMEGYQVTTNQHVYQVLISNYRACCENFGYIASEDDLSVYLGAVLLDVKLTDTARSTTMLNSEELGDLDEVRIQFVDFVTDKGVFQLAVYNGHNGYYGHDVKVIKDADVLLNDGL